MAKFPVSGNDIPEIDLREISIGELQDLLDPVQPASEANDILARATGLKPAEIRKLKVHDFRALISAVFVKSWQPLENDPKN